MVPEKEASQAGAPTSDQRGPDAPDVLDEPRIETSEAEQVPEAASPATRTPGDDWPIILLRRDGARPVRFRGQPIVSFTGSYDLGGWDCLQDVALFLAQHNQIYLGLSLHPPHGVGARPVFACFEVTETPLEPLLARWSTRVRDHIPLQRSVDAPPPPRIAPAEVTAGFHTLTAQCFRAEPAQPERNNECRQ